MTGIEFESSLDMAASKLYPAAMQLTRDPEATKDLIQLTFMKAWKHKNDFSPGTNFNAWLYIIMKNSFISDYKKNKRRKTFTDSTNNQYLINATGLPHIPQPDSQLHVRDIKNTINALPSKLKRPFRLFIEGYKYDEICEQLSLPLGTVKNRIFLARQQLKLKLMNN